MISILCVDDSPEAARACRRVIEDAAAPAAIEFVEAASVVAAKRQLTDRQFDVALIDIVLPIRDAEPPRADGGLAVLDYLLSGSRAKRPRYVIGMSAEAHVLQTASPRFLQSMFTIFERGPSDGTWREPLENFIKYLVSQESRSGHALDDQGLAPLPLAIVCAVAEEFRAIRRIFALSESLNIPGDHTTYFLGEVQCLSGSHKVVGAQAAEQGMPVCAALVSKIICRFRPRYVAMSGIAAALTRDLKFGDVVFAEQTWDYTTGKMTVDSVGAPELKPESRNLRADPITIEQMRRLSTDAAFLSKVRTDWPAATPDSILSVKMGPIASGGSVVEDSRICEAILDRDRKTLGLDMEAHAVAAACWYGLTPKPNFVIAKGVVDHGSPPKTDEWHSYASYTSACVIFEWACRAL